MRRCCAVWLFAVLVGCGGSDKQAPPRAPVKVKVATLQEQSIPESTDLLGSLNSRQSVTLTPQVSGHISAILVKAGDKVQAGQALIQVDPAKERAALAALEAVKNAREGTARLAEANYERASKLAAAGVMSAQELQQSTTALNSAKADLAAAESQVRAQQVQLEYYRITAPNAGTVGDIPVKVGDIVGPTTRLMLLNQSEELEAQVSVPLNLAPKLNPQSRIALLGPEDKPIVEAPLSFISSAVDPETQSVLVKAAFPNNQNLRFAQFVRTRITFAEKRGLKVPTTAVSRMSGQFFVYVVQAGQGGQKMVEQRNVQLGELIGDGYVVMKGLQAGDQVVTQGVQKVRNGVPIEPEA